MSILDHDEWMTSSPKRAAKNMKKQKLEVNGLPCKTHFSALIGHAHSIQPISTVATKSMNKILRSHLSFTDRVICQATCSERFFL